MNARGKTAVNPTRDQIDRMARQLWEQNGRPSARDWDYWLQAECELRSARLPSKALKAANLMILK